MVVLHIMARINIIPVRGILNKTENAPKKMKMPPIHIIIIIMLVLHDMIHWDSTKLKNKNSLFSEVRQAFLCFGGRKNNFRVNFIIGTLFGRFSFEILLPSLNC